MATKASNETVGCCLLLRGEKRDALAMTEPDAGSDVRGMKATAVKQPDGDWILNGTKHFISGAE